MKSKISVKLIATGMAEVLVDGDISAFDVSSNYIREQVSRHDLKPGDKVLFRINSIGGNTQEGFSIYDQMAELKEMGIIVATKAEGVAASMGSILLVAGTKGHREMSPTALLMIHNPQGGIQGEEKDMKKMAEILSKIKGIALEVYTKSTDKLSEEDITAMMDEVTWMTAQEALDNGFIDAISGSEEESTMAAALPEGDRSLAALNVFMKAAALEHTKHKQTETSPNSKNSKMKEIIAKALGLDATMADDKFEAALSQKIATLTSAATELATVKDELAKLKKSGDEAAQAAFESMLSGAVTAKKITQAQADSYMKLGHGAADQVKEILDGIDAPASSVSMFLQREGGEGNGGDENDRSKWTHKDWGQKDPEGLRAMMKGDPEAYKELVDKTYSRK